MEGKTIYVIGFLNDIEVEGRLRKSLPDVDIVMLPTKHHSFSFHTCDQLEEDTDGISSKIEVMFTDVPIITRYRHKLANLKWVHTSWNGVDILMKAVAEDKEFPKFTMTKFPGIYNSVLMTEFVIGYILAIERSIFLRYEKQKETDWFVKGRYNNEIAGRTLSELSIGILGVGAIGAKLAKTCQHFGMTVWGLTRKSRKPEDQLEFIDHYRTTDQLTEVLSNSDVIVNLLPSTPQTRNLLSGDVLECCRSKRTMFINVGRGDVIDDQSMINAMTNGWLSVAVLDTFINEPLEKTSPLWSLPNTFISPHVSAWSTSGEYIDKQYEFFIENARRYFEGRPLKNVLDWAQGY